MLKNLIPPIVAKPSFPLSLSINRHDPRRSKSTRAHSQFHNAFLVLRRNSTLHDLLKLRGREDAFQSFENAG
jgi:hypothetical protein